MADPSHPFMSALITLVLKRDSLHIPNKNTFSFSLLHHVFSLKHYHTFTPINHYTMTPVKSQGSSCHKGKKIASNDPTTQDVGEEAAHSDSDYSDKEKAWHDPDSKCAPLMDPWYDTHDYFPKVPGEYMPPGRVWLALCHRNTDISWAPLASLIPDLVIRQGTSLLVPILFKFGSGTTLGWKEWVDNEFSDIGFMEALQWASVLKAIVLSPCLSNYRDL